MINLVLHDSATIYLYHTSVIWKHHSVMTVTEDPNIHFGNLYELGG